MATTPTANFRFGFDDGGLAAGSEKAADAQERLRAAMAKSEEEVKDLSASFRRIRGNSDEAKKAKEALRAKIIALKDSISSSNLALLKQGTSYEKLTQKTKKLAQEQAALRAKMADDRARALSQTISGVGGPVSTLTGKLGALKELLQGAGGGMGVLSLAAIGAVAAIAAVTAATVAGVVALGKWIVTTANASRTMGLMREAWVGNAQNAHNLGTQIDALALKVPTAKAQLNDLAISLAKGGVQGQTLVDTLHALGQANSALGDDAGAKLREFIDRGRLTQRFQVNPLELQGSGVQFDEIAKSLAENMHVGINEARRALFAGNVKLGDGAAALRKTIETKFGRINLARMLDVNVAAEKFKEILGNLTKDVDLSPILEGMKSLSGLFDQTSYSGVALKTLVTVFGNSLGYTFKTLAPYAAQFFKGLVIASLDVTIAVFKLKKEFEKTFGGNTVLKNVDLLKVSLIAGKTVIMGFVAGVLTLTAVVVAAAAPFVYLGSIAVDAFTGLYKAGQAVFDWFGGQSWESLGTSIVDGLVRGLKANVRALESGVKGVAEGAKKAFKEALGIKSPSTVFAEFGKHTVSGFSQGVEDHQDRADKAIAGMALPPKNGGGVSGRVTLATTSAPVIHLHFELPAGADAKAVAAAVSGADVMSALTKAIQDANRGAGIKPE